MSLISKVLREKIEAAVKAKDINGLMKVITI